VSRAAAAIITLTITTGVDRVHTRRYRHRGSIEWHDGRYHRAYSVRRRARITRNRVGAWNVRL